MEQGWSEQGVLTVTGIVLGTAIIIAAIRGMFGGGGGKDGKKK